MMHDNHDMCNAYYIQGLSESSCTAEEHLCTLFISSCHSHYLNPCSLRTWCDITALLVTKNCTEPCLGAQRTEETVSGARYMPFTCEGGEVVSKIQPLMEKLPQQNRLQRHTYTSPHSFREKSVLSRAIVNK